MADAATITLAPEEQAVISALEKLNVIQLNNVVKYMEQAYGISAAAPVAVAAAPAGGAGAAAAEEKSAYNVELTDSGAQKIAVIKENVDKAAAEEMKKKLEAAGAKVSLK